MGAFYVADLAFRTVRRFNNCVMRNAFAYPVRRHKHPLLVLCASGEERHVLRVKLTPQRAFVGIVRQPLPAHHAPLALNQEAQQLLAVRPWQVGDCCLIYHVAAGGEAASLAMRVLRSSSAMSLICIFPVMSCFRRSEYLSGIAPFSMNISSVSL